MWMCVSSVCTVCGDPSVLSPSCVFYSVSLFFIVCVCDFVKVSVLQLKGNAHSCILISIKNKMTKVTCKLQICKWGPIFYPELPVTAVTYETVFFLKHWSRGAHQECYHSLSTATQPNVTSWHGNYFCSATRCRCTAIVSALSLQSQLSKLPGPQEVVKEASPGKLEEGAGKEGGQGLWEFRDVF